MSEDSDNGSIRDRLKRLLEEGGDWERKPTSVPGMFLVRMPQYKSRPPSLAVEINPVDSTGKPSKRKGVMIRSASELDEIAKVISDPKVAEIVRAIDDINPSPQRKDVFEI